MTRPRQHFRHVKTKRGRKRILINKGVKPKRRKVKRRMAGGLGAPPSPFKGFFKKKPRGPRGPKFPIRTPKVRAASDSEFSKTSEQIWEDQDMMLAQNRDKVIDDSLEALNRITSQTFSILKGDATAGMAEAKGVQISKKKRLRLVKK